jgi:serine/threonine protein kinase
VADAPKTNLPHTIQARYKLGEQIGEGGYSVVRVGTSNIDKKKVAVKIVKRQGLSQEDEESLRSEVEILLKLRHPNIVQAFDFFEEVPQFYVILEYIDGGELFDRIVKKTFYNEKEARDLVFIVLTAIKYLHDKNIVHRDLKPENLLLTSKSDDANIKIADFGFATKVDGLSLTAQLGTPGYIAPEILTKKPCKFSVILVCWLFFHQHSSFHLLFLFRRKACRHVVIRCHFVHPVGWLSSVSR